MNKTNKIEHTPEPWEVEPRGNPLARQYIEAGEYRIAETITIRQAENAKRIVACVNACHDIEDPDRAHAVARDAIRAAFDYLDGLDFFDLLPPEESLRISRRLAHLSEAHALLGGGPL